MPGPYRITDLASLGSTPMGSEIMEISNGGTGSFQVPMAVVGQGRQPTVISSGGTTTVNNNSYGDYLVTTTSAVTINLPSSLLRNGVPVSVVAATTSTPNITIVRFGSETIFGLSANITITHSYGAFTLWPNATGTGDWYQK